MYKSCFLGCGGRSREHARAYQYVKNGKLAAICDLDEERLNACGEEFGIEIEKRYVDFHKMLDKERPDLLHIITAPIGRDELMIIAAEHEVPVVIVEKPFALQGEDFRRIRELNAKCKTKFVINTQLPFHPRILELKRDVAEGRIGDIRFIDISARSTIINQGVHVLALAHSFNGFAAPTSVFGNVSGANSIPTHEPSPDVAEATIAFENGVRAQLLTGEIAPKTSDNDPRVRHKPMSVYGHKRISVYGTRGFIYWTMTGWERFTPKGGYESGTHSYGEEDVLAQAALTDAAFDWVKDEEKPHPTRLERALVMFNVILGVYVSALTNAPISLPFEPPDVLIDSLKSRLTL